MELVTKKRLVLVAGRANHGLAEEVAAARTGALAMELAWQGHFVARGRHRLRFVHNMTTCQVKALEPGGGNFGMVVDDKGKLVAQLRLDAEDDALLIETGREDVDTVIAQLTRYRVADDVRFERDERWSVVALIGPEAAATLTRAGLGSDLPEATCAWRDVEVDGLSLRVRRTAHRLGADGMDLRVAIADAPALMARLTDAGATAIGLDAWSALRVAAGWPADGVDMGAGNLPLESERLYETVDWDKGCYIGQEVIAMTHYRGRPNRHLRAVRCTGDGVLETGSDLVAAPGGKPVGIVGTVAEVPGQGAVALAVIKRKHAAPDTTLLLSDGAAVQVLALPLPG